MKIEELIASVKNSVEAKKVYAEPYERNGITVIAAASVSGGTGGGSGRDEKGQEGEGGGGFGISAKPTGAFVINGNDVRWVPAVDVNRLIATMGAVAVAAIFVAARFFKSRSDREVHAAISEPRTCSPDEVRTARTRCPDCELCAAATRPPRHSSFVAVKSHHRPSTARLGTLPPDSSARPSATAFSMDRCLAV
ncbi:spore germination protein GerW family protein [Lentzea kentuckyensis]|uniref:spore germination protein GerW family protein n=1 Tax=Lentzea kentuckyensis TaxID=360086 RepID=UPI001FE466BC|nr:spore germination protein GerW family protein [Lentzea kentuckyensis]